MIQRSNSKPRSPIDQISMQKSDLKTKKTEAGAGTDRLFHLFSAHFYTPGGVLCRANFQGSRLFSSKLYRVPSDRLSMCVSMCVRVCVVWCVCLCMCECVGVCVWTNRTLHKSAFFKKPISKEGLSIQLVSQSIQNLHPT